MCLYEALANRAAYLPCHSGLPAPTPTPQDHLAALTARKKTHTGMWLNVNRNCRVQREKWNDTSPSWSRQVSEKVLRGTTKWCGDYAGITVPCHSKAGCNPLVKTEGQSCGNYFWAAHHKQCSSCQVAIVFISLKCLCCDYLHYRYPVNKVAIFFCLCEQKRGTCKLLNQLLPLQKMMLSTHKKPPHIIITTDISYCEYSGLHLTLIDHH